MANENNSNIQDTEKKNRRRGIIFWLLFGLILFTGVSTVAYSALLGDTEAGNVQGVRETIENTNNSDNRFKVCEDNPNPKKCEELQTV